MVEVDQHRPVRDHALLPDAHPLVRGDRALLAEDRLGADLHDPFMTADLGPIPYPGEAAEPDLRTLADLELQALAEEDGTVGLPAPARGRQEAAPQVAPEQSGIAPIEHAFAAEEAEQADHGRRF